MFWAIDYACLALIVTSAVLVVRLRNLAGAVMALSALGTVLGLLFIVLGAPDDAHAQIVVGSIALPTLYLIAIGKVRTVIGNEPELGEQGAGGQGVSGQGVSGHAAGAQGGGRAASPAPGGRDADRQGGGA